MGESTAVLTQFISAIIGMVNTLAEGYTRNAAGKAVFVKESQIQDAVLNNMLDRYSSLENKIAEADLTKYQQDLVEETSNQVFVGNIKSIVIALIIIALIVTAVIWAKK